MYKKLLSFTLIILIILSFTACGKPAQETIPVASTDPIIETTEETVPGIAHSIFDDVETEGNTKEQFVAEVENTASATEAVETKPSETKPTTPKPNEPKPTEPKPTEPKPTESKPTESKPAESKPTEPKPTEPKPTEPKPTEPKPTDPKPVEATEYEKYMAMSGAEQKAYMESFESIEAFFGWLEDAKAEYEAAHPDIPIGDGTIDLGKITG